MRHDKTCAAPGCTRYCWWHGEENHALVFMGWRFVEGHAICPDHVKFLELGQLMYQERLFD